MLASRTKPTSPRRPSANLRRGFLRWRLTLWRGEHTSCPRVAVRATHVSARATGSAGNEPNDHTLVAAQLEHAFDAFAIAVEVRGERDDRNGEHTSELQSHSFISYAVFCLKQN